MVRDHPTRDDVDDDLYADLRLYYADRSLVTLHVSLDRDDDTLAADLRRLRLASRAAYRRLRAPRADGDLRLNLRVYAADANTFFLNSPRFNLDRLDDADDAITAYLHSRRDRRRVVRRLALARDDLYHRDDLY
ncbi:unnamed protein product [Didymodactylos carnosus]|uniref:Uncharacterized protein n=1 Tax=Didymodactylos carnosus TaxID=1234261 RepID=A0A815BQU9_9BILA|nr:unnamed protein product [Didymodactylos carnosus]CAF4062629.1 unnamed protein product [Didymodactylos carnosus]